MPATEIGNPIAADVPMAFLISRFFEVKYGTVNEPPPIETNADIAPIPVDEISKPLVFMSLITSLSVF